MTPRSVDDYIEMLPEEKSIIAQKIRDIILTTIPGVAEKISFKIPFYRYYGMFMYMNQVKTGIEVAFLRGKDLTELFPRLDQKNRKIVASIIITRKEDIATTQLVEIIATAAAWNEEAAGENRTFLTSNKTRKKKSVSGVKGRKK
jgi:hypothetical protein